MGIGRGILDNLSFLLAEVGSQVTTLRRHMRDPNPLLAQRILDRSGYAFNLKQRIHKSCLGEIARREEGKADLFSLRAVESISTDLERITELCRDCIQQMAYLENPRCLRGGEYVPMLKQVARGMELIEPALNDRNTGVALKIGRVEQKLDRGYRKMLKAYSGSMRRRRHTRDLVSSLFVARAVEQMGDAMLNISDAIISANLGQPINTERYYSIKASLEYLDQNENLSDLVVETVAETRSGSGISGIGKADDDGYMAIYKDGKKHKLKEEREGVESWHQIYPGLAPKILAYNKKGQSASLLIEHLDGLTFEQILLHESPRLLRQTLKQLTRTLADVWRETHSKQPVSAGYVKQLIKRLPEVYGVHADFRQPASRICGHKSASMDQLLRRAAEFEARLKAPFSVYIHGDFNVDNILYDPLEKRINFIDLHRSRYMDYVQDVSVFMVSNYRLQVLDRPVRRRIADLSEDFYGFAADFAAHHKDQGFELRLGLGLARSFITSTRFILDRSLAEAMFLRGRYLLEQVVSANPKKPAGFRLPIREIFVG